MAAAPLAPVADPSAHQNPEIPRMQEDPEISAKKFLELGRSERHAVKTCEPGESTAFAERACVCPAYKKTHVVTPEAEGRVWLPLSDSDL